MRKRSMSSALNIHPEHGLYAVISGQVPLTTAAVQTQTPRMFFLDAEPHIPNPSDLLNSRHFSRLIKEMTNAFDYVIFDTPPVGTFVDAAVLGAKVDATFLVVRENFTRRDEIQRAVDQLKKGNVNLAGVIMNFCERQSSEYYYEYYYKERERRSRKGRKHRRPEKEAPAPEPAVASPAVAQRAQRWDNAPTLDDGAGSSPQPAEGAAHLAFQTQGTELSEAVVDLRSQVGSAQQARQEQAKPRIETASQPKPAAEQAAVPNKGAAVSSRPNDDMSRYRRRKR